MGILCNDESIRLSASLEKIGFTTAYRSPVGNWKDSNSFLQILLPNSWFLGK